MTTTLTKHIGMLEVHVRDLDTGHTYSAFLSEMPVWIVDGHRLIDTDWWDSLNRRYFEEHNSEILTPRTQLEATLNGNVH